MFNSIRYKDKEPKQTIQYARDFLHSMGLLTIEKWFDSYDSNFYSVFLRVDGMLYGTFGKGITRENALASAYGEFMERMQNQMLYQGDINPSLSKRFLFLRSSDEKKMDLNEVLEQNFFTNKEKANILYNEIQKYCQQVKDEKLTVLPFYDVTGKTTVYIPIIVADTLFYTNGMSAGNTYQEALVQALCEIFERHSMKRIIKEKITPPTIPYCYLKKYPEIAQVINTLESKKNYSVIVKDCSLGEGIPVVCIVVIDKQNNKYMIRFGSHPVFEIAIERCFTEIFQGKNINNITINKFTFSDIEDVLQKRNIFRSGIGNFPIDFFEDKESYSFSEYDDISSKSNSYLANILLKRLEKFHLPILIRDESISDIVSLRIIVPGFSEIFDKANYTDYSHKSQAHAIMRNIHNAKNEELHILYDFIVEAEKIDGNLTLANLLNIPVDTRYALVNSSIQFLKFLILYKMDEIHKAFNELQMLSLDETVNKDYFICLKEFLCALDKGQMTNYIFNILRKFYLSDVVDKVYQQFINYDNFFDSFYLRTNCWDCDHCKADTCCSYLMTEKFYSQVLANKNKKTINQQEKISYIMNQICY